jgi:TonB family protein
MSATFSKLGPLSVESSVSGFGPHIEELHGFFKTRGVEFGSPQHLKPFMDRLDSDTGFRDEIASLVRTIIYRERDGLSWAELMELLAAAVGGPGLDDVTEPEVRDAERRLMAFVENVFRTRRNPVGANIASAVQAVSPEVVEAAAAPVAEQQAVSDVVPAEAASNAAATEPPNGVEPSKMDMFFRARKVAEEREFGAVVEHRIAENRIAENVERLELPDDETELGTAFQPNLKWHIPFEDFEDRETAERGSPAWLWVAGLCALLLAFCAGLFVHQRLIVPLRAANTPYEPAPPEAQRGPAPLPAPAEQHAATGAVDPNPTEAKTTPAAKPVAANARASDVTQLPKYMSPATVGASAAVMESRLVYAPRPSYPMMAEMTRIQGKVTVEAVVGRSGRVIRAQAINGHRLLRGAAVRAVYGRRYRPYTVNGRPVNVATMVTVDFKLKR